MTWRDDVTAISLDTLPCRIVNRARVALVAANGDGYLATLIENDQPQAVWSFGVEGLENTKARFVRFLGVYE